MSKPAPASVATLALAATLSLARGDDGASADPAAAPAGEAEGAAGAGAADAGGAWLVRFTNGDVLRGDLERIEERRLTLRAPLLPGEPLTFGIDEVVEAWRAPEPAEPAPGAAAASDEPAPEDLPAFPPDYLFPASAARAAAPPRERLALRDGSLLYGVALGVDDRALRFDATGLGEVAVPLAAIRELDRRGAEADPAGGPPPEAGLVVTTAGDRLVGRLGATPGGELRVAGDVVRAALPLEHVARAVFGARPAAASGTEAETRHTVRLRSGAVVQSPSPVRLACGRLSCALWAEAQVVDAALEDVESVAFLGGPVALTSRRVVVWSAWADVDEEHAHTVEALRRELPTFSVEDTATDDPAELRRELLEARALVISEPESWSAPDEGRTRELRRVLHELLARGGNVVLLCFGPDQTDFLRRAELLDVRRTGSVDSTEEIALTGSHRTLARGLDGPFRGVNATTAYRVGPGLDAEVLAAAGDDRAVVVARRVGRGWVLLLGMDFYDRRVAHDRVLANAARFR